MASKTHPDKTKLLHIAVKEADLNTVTNLCNAGTDVNAQDAYGNTPLMLAADHGSIDIVEELVAHKAKINLVDKYGQTALMYAAFGGHWNVVKFLVEGKASVNAASKYGQTALMKAAYNNALPVVILLVNAKANVDAVSAEGRTAVMVAAENNNLHVLQHLVESAKANVNAQDQNGNTAVMLAARSGHMLIVEYLTEVGVNLDTVNKMQQTLYEVPPANGNTKQSEHEARIRQAVKTGAQNAVKKAEDREKAAIMRAAEESKWKLKMSTSTWSQADLAASASTVSLPAAVGPREQVEAKHEEEKKE